MSAIDEAVRGVARAMRATGLIIDPRTKSDLNEPIDTNEERVAQAAITAYRAHTLAGAGEVEIQLRQGDDYDGRSAFKLMLVAADLIAAQRERIAELESRSQISGDKIALRRAIRMLEVGAGEKLVSFQNDERVALLACARAALEGKK